MRRSLLALQWEQVPVGLHDSLPNPVDVAHVNVLRTVDCRGERVRPAWPAREVLREAGRCQPLGDLVAIGVDAQDGYSRSEGHDRWVDAGCHQESQARKVCAEIAHAGKLGQQPDTVASGEPHELLEWADVDLLVT